jgi:hypothetical protein
VDILRAFVFFTAAALLGSPPYIDAVVAVDILRAFDFFTAAAL